MNAFVGICLIAFVAFAQALPDEMKQRLQEFYNVCKAESKVTDETLNKLRAGAEIEDETIHNYVYCMFKKIGFINDKDELQIDIIKAKSPEELNQSEIQKVFEACKNVKGYTIRETARKLYSCFVKTSGKQIEF